MSKRRVIVCERTGIWATVLARALSGDAHLVQVRGLAECVGRLREAPASVVALEVSRASLAAALEFLGELPLRYARARAIVLCAGELGGWELPLREAGALHVVASPRELAGLRRTIVGHFDRVGSVPTDLAARVWESLPWSDAATTLKG
jgi:hypothetical protein